MKVPHRLWPWALLGVPGLGVVELLAHLYFRGRTPKLEDYAALEPVVSEMRQASELVVATPNWAEPNLRWALGDALMPLADVARPEESRYAAAIEVLLPGVTSAFPQWSVEASHRVDGFLVQRLKNPEYEPVLFDFVEQFSPQRVSVDVGRGSQNRKPCAFNAHAAVTNGALGGHATFPAQRFECGSAEWDFVGLTVIEDQNYRPRRCLWAQPPSGKRSKSVRYRDVRLGARITGHTGIPYLVDRGGKGAPIALSVKIDGETIGVVHHENGVGWQPFSVQTSAQAGTDHSVEFEVVADNSNKRDFCFHADVR